jgi:hypothetical protein
MPLQPQLPFENAIPSLIKSLSVLGVEEADGNCPQLKPSIEISA